MKLPLVSRKKFDDVYSELQVQKGENLVSADLLEVKEKELSKIKDYYMDLMQEVVALREEKKDLEKQVDLMSEYNDKVTNKNCELSTKLIAALAINDKHEEKIQELEFCIKDCKYENRQMMEVIKRTNIVKNNYVI